ncbi:MAG: N-acetylmuramoyl-L-alanine amidase, partial [Lysobacter sp.]
HAAHALLGWQDELAFLGVGAQSTAMSQGAGRGAYARAQEIITPFYDPADPATALTCQADAFSLAREEWFAGVPNTTIFPHSAICLLEMRDSGGNVARGTGFYIGRNRILTCGHNLHGMASVEIIPGKNGQGSGTEPFGRCTVTSASWRIPTSYGGSNPAYDLAVIDNVPIAAPGDRWFDVLEELNQSRPEGVVVCGYSSRSTKVPDLTAAIDGFKQHLHAGYIAALGVGDSTFDYPILTLKRASGSPVYYISDKDGSLKAYIVGVHTGSATEDMNRGCRLTHAKIDWIEGRTTTLALGANRYSRALLLEEDPQDAKGISEAIPDETYAAEQSYRQARALDVPQAEYPGASRFAPAYSGNYRTSRSQRTIDRIVIHITDGGSRITGTIGWFQNPDQRNSRNEHITVSAHYVIGRDGEVVQMVRHNDVAWHASSANSHSIGIEHVANKRGLDPTEEEYQASSRLVAWLCAQYSVPVDRDHILGHQEASPRDNHDCPSKLWNWDHFMDCVRAAALPAPTAQSLGTGRRPLSRAQDIITPFYDPSSPSSALTCQDNAFSLAREEWFVGVDDTRAFPHSAICQLLMTDSAGNAYGGTGFYIGSNRILTCAHNLHGMVNVTVIPGQNGATGKPFGQTTLPSSAWRIAPRYSGTGNWENDLAVIDNVPIAAPNGQWFQFLNATPSEHMPIVVCGYSGASRAVPELTAAIDGDKQHLHGGYAASQSNGEVIEYPILTLQGASGSPVYHLDRSSGELQALICAV